MTTRRSALILVLALAVVVSPELASTDGIGPGFDLLSTPSGGGILPSPVGPIPLRGVPIDPVKLGNTDTIIQRLTGLPAGGTGVIQAEMVQLSLMSVNPVELRAGSFFDIFVSVADPVVGEIMITSHDDAAGGGTFDSRLPVVVRATGVPVGGGDPVDLGIFQDVVGSIGTPWSHTPTPNYPTALPAGGFFITAAGINHTGPHPRNDPASVPEPVTLLVLGAGLAGLGAVAWGRRRSG